MPDWAVPLSVGSQHVFVTFKSQSRPTSIVSNRLFCRRLWDNPTRYKNRYDEIALATKVVVKTLPHITGGDMLSSHTAQLAI